jgi:hypothetical protein
MQVNDRPKIPVHIKKNRAGATNKWIYILRFADAEESNFRMQPPQKLYVSGPDDHRASKVKRYVSPLAEVRLLSSAKRTLIPRASSS